MSDENPEDNLQAAIGAIDLIAIGMLADAVGVVLERVKAKTKISPEEFHAARMKLIRAATTMIEHAATFTDLRSELDKMSDAVDASEKAAN